MIVYIGFDLVRQTRIIHTVFATNINHDVAVIGVHKNYLEELF